MSFATVDGIRLHYRSVRIEFASKVRARWPMPRCSAGSAVPSPRASRLFTRRFATHSCMRTAKGTQAIADGVVGARFVELDAQHLSNIERAEEFTQAVLDFLTTPTAARL